MQGRIYKSLDAKAQSRKEEFKKPFAALRLCVKF
jgi:hypothetical protein